MPSPGELVTLDDDLNLNMSELAGTMGILRKPIARFNALPRAQKLEQIVAGTLRYGPYAMFALLPAFAALLKVLYLGPRRRYPARPRLYGEHLVFAAHNHAFLFVVGSLMGVSPNGWVTGVLATWALVYLAWSTRAVYGGRWLGIAVRALVLVVAYTILFAFVTIGLAGRGRPAALNPARRAAASRVASHVNMRTSHSERIGKKTSSVTRMASEMRNGTTPLNVSAIGTSRARLLMM